MKGTVYTDRLATSEVVPPMEAYLENTPSTLEKKKENKLATQKQEQSKKEELLALPELLLARTAGVTAVVHVPHPQKGARIETLRQD